MKENVDADAKLDWIAINTQVDPNLEDKAFLLWSSSITSFH